MVEMTGGVDFAVLQQTKSVLHFSFSQKKINLFIKLLTIARNQKLMSSLSGVI